MVVEVLFRIYRRSQYTLKHQALFHNTVRLLHQYQRSYAATKTSVMPSSMGSIVRGTWLATSGANTEVRQATTFAKTFPALGLLTDQTPASSIIGAITPTLFRSPWCLGAVMVAGRTHDLPQGAGDVPTYHEPVNLGASVERGRLACGTRPTLGFAPIRAAHQAAT